MPSFAALQGLLRAVWAVSARPCFGSPGSLVRARTPNSATGALSQRRTGASRWRSASCLRTCAASRRRSETMTPAAAAAMANRFYAHATDVLVRHVAIIDKMEGDAIMALFIPRFIWRTTTDGSWSMLLTICSPQIRAIPRRRARSARVWMLGTAFVGNVGAGAVKDFTAIGDVVNTASRLQGLAAAGQIAMSEHVFNAVRDQLSESGGERRAVAG